MGQNDDFLDFNIVKIILDYIITEIGNVDMVLK
jgi:hypothetical protein